MTKGPDANPKSHAKAVRAGCANAQGRAKRYLLACVNLRPLQFIRVIDVDRLPRRVEIERAGAAFAMAVAGLLNPAEGKMHFSPNRWRVHVGDAGFEVPHRAECPVDVPRVDRSREPVLNIVGDGNGVVEAGAFEDADHRAKDLFLRDTHAGFDFPDHRWGKDVALGKPSLVPGLSPCPQLR